MQRPLKGTRCLVDTFSEDGIDASAYHKKNIESLGGVIDDVFSEELTHLIFSNGKYPKRLKAAESFDVYVVSPLWIEQCKQAKKRVSEDDFLITSFLTAIDNIKPSAPQQSSSTAIVQSKPSASIFERKNIQRPGKLCSYFYFYFLYTFLTCYVVFMHSDRRSRGLGPRQ